MTVATAAAGTAASPRWTAHPAWALAVRVLVAAGPVVAGIAAAALASRLLDSPRPDTIPWWLAVFAIATVASVLVAAAIRRLLPLAVLLGLSLAFPDHVPSRFRVALRAGGVSRLRRQVESVREHGVDSSPGAAAETILELATALNVHDARTRGHSERVRAFTELIATEMHLSAEDRDRVRWAALLHDCGKLMVHRDVLNKHGHLDDDEWAHVRRHPIEGARLAAPLAGWLGPWARAIEEHHERWDGFGYPFGRARDEISVGARIVAVADAFDVMTSARSYQRAISPAAARTELAREAGHQFDPEVVRAFLAVSIGRLRWLVGPISWLAELPVIRSAASAPTVAAPAALTAVTLAAVSALGVVTPPGGGRAVGVAPPHVALAAPVEARLPVGPPAPVVMVDTPTEVLAEQVTAAADTPTPTGPAQLPAVVTDGGPPPGLVLPPGTGPAAACTEAGLVSGVVDDAVEPAAAMVAEPLADAVDAANCAVVVPAEGLLAGLLAPTPLAEIVGHSSLLP